jgi:hypothetical protein
MLYLALTRIGGAGLYGQNYLIDAQMKPTEKSPRP